MTDNLRMVWANGNGLKLRVDSGHAPVYLQELYMVALKARAFGGEIFRFTYDWTNPEDGHTTSGAGRLVYEELPDPRQSVESKGEGQ